MLFVITFDTKMFTTIVFYAHAHTHVYKISNASYTKICYE